MRLGLALVTVALLAPALAGCGSKGETPGASSGGSITQGGAPIVDPTPAAPLPRGTSQRWHFHDYWQGNPTITLVSADVELNATYDDAGAHVLSALVTLPQGKVVPAETGFLLVNATWALPAGEGTVPRGGEINLTYKPADSNDYAAAGNVTNGVARRINTTESMCDVPHRQESLWRFNFSAISPSLGGVPAAPTSPGAPSRTIHVNVTATIGRPLFIDPPHLDWWMGSDVLPLVSGAKGSVAATAQTAVGNLTLPRDPQAAQPSSAQRPVRVPVDAGRIVPEGTASLVVVVNWTTSVPGGKLALRYSEGNYPSEGALTVVKDGAGSRTFVTAIQPPQTDTTYSNRTTWEFRLVPEGQAPFEGEFELAAWVTKLAPADAVKAVTGGA